jgi:hypothetical protein
MNIPGKQHSKISYTNRVCISFSMLVILLTVSCTENMIVHRSLSKFRHTWQHDSLTHTTIYYQPGSFAEANLDYLGKNIEKKRADILHMMGEADYPARVEVFFLSGKQEVEKYLKIPGEGRAYPKDNVAVFVYSADFRGYTRHELTHVISINLWGKSSQWIQEGFAALSDEDRQTKDFHSQAAAILGTDKFIPIENIFRRFEDYNGIWYRYVETASLLRFIREKYGNTALKQVWHNKHASWEGHTEKDIVAEWLGMLKNISIK